LLKAKKSNVVTYTLELSETEANWLRGIMQNPLYDIEPADESPLDTEMRESFWNALSIPHVESEIK